MEINTTVFQGDAGEILQNIQENTVDLIVTSPPYADQRKDTYGGIPTDKYVEWFLPISKELLRVLKPTGTFILNIKERVINGERSIYVESVYKVLKKQDFSFGFFQDDLQ
jgi:site-specific DNA-methyltransferase (adenine-specific)/site-specific DNA-methyltransferase (cytosine-N4-specific)